MRKIMENAEPLCDALIKKGKQGDIQAIKEIMDRGVGKVPQAVTGSEGGPVEILIRTFSEAKEEAQP